MGCVGLHCPPRCERVIRFECKGGSELRQEILISLHSHGHASTFGWEGECSATLTYQLGV